MPATLMSGNVSIAPRFVLRKSIFATVADGLTPALQMIVSLSMRRPLVSVRPRSSADATPSPVSTSTPRRARTRREYSPILGGRPASSTGPASTSTT